MVEVNHIITVIRDDSVIESKFADPAPIAEGTPLKYSRAPRRTFVSHFDVEGERAFGHSITWVKDLRHDFFTKIQRRPFDPGLLWRNEEPHEFRAPRGFIRWFAKLSDLVQLAVRWFLINTLKERARDE